MNSLDKKFGLKIINEYSIVDIYFSRNYFFDLYRHRNLVKSSIYHKEFYVAGGGVGAWANGMATAADWMSAASFISMAGVLFPFAGYDGAVYLMGWTGGYVLLALLLAPYLRKFGKFTVPEFIDRYYSNNARVSCRILCFISFIYLRGWSNEGCWNCFFKIFRGWI